VTRRRVIVSESVWRNRLDRVWLDLLDTRFNRFRHGGRMPRALDFRRAGEWRRMFEARGLRVAHEAWVGSRGERLVHHPRLFVLDLPAAAEGAAPGRHDGAPCLAGAG
jgi:hypothetical protein